MSKIPDDPQLLAYDSTGPRLYKPAVISMVLGLLAIPIDIVLFTGTVFGLAAVVMGIFSIIKINRSPHLTGKAFAIAGIALGVTSWILAIGCGILLGGFR